MELDQARQMKMVASRAYEEFEKAIEEFGDLCSDLDENIIQRSRSSVEGIDKVEGTAIQQEKNCRVFQVKELSTHESTCNLALQWNKIAVYRKQKLNKKAGKGSEAQIGYLFSLCKKIEVNSYRNIPLVRKIRMQLPENLNFTPAIPQADTPIAQMIYFGFRMITRNILEIRTPRKTVGKGGAGEGEFNTSYGITTHPENGNVYVADFCNHRIQVFDENMEFLFQFGARGKGPEDYEYPSALGFTSDGQTLIIVDNDNRRVKLTDPNGKLLKIIDGSTSNTQKFDEPYFLALDQEDNFYVSDRDNSRIQKYDKDGNFVMFIGDRTHSNPVGRVCAIIVTEKGELIALEEGGDNLKFYTTQGEFLRSVSIPPTQSRKNFLARSSNGGYMLSDRGSNCISFFDSSHSICHRIDINSPLGIAFGVNETLYVVGCDSSTVSLF